MTATKTKTHTNVYIVMYIGYEYDDEVYTAYEDDAGYNQNAYRTRERAEEECFKMNKAHFKQIDRLCEYSREGLGWHLESDQFAELQKILFEMKLKNNEGRVFKSSDEITEEYILETSNLFLKIRGNDEQWKKLLSLLKFCEGYKVDEVEVLDG